MSPTAALPTRMIDRLAALWGLGGIALLLGNAIHRLSIVVVDAASYDLDGRHWLVCAALTAFMAHVKGYLVFQKRLAPRVAARARALGEIRRPLAAFLAPLYCMGYFHTTARRQRTTIAMTCGVVLLIVLVRSLAQPWRGIVDLGVVVALGWGLVAILYQGMKALMAKDFPHSPELPTQ